MISRVLYCLHRKYFKCISMIFIMATKMYGQCGYFEKSFSELISNSDKIVNGTVKEINYDKDYIEYLFIEVNNEKYKILMENLLGFDNYGNPYLEKNKKYTLCLKKGDNDSYWEIVSQGVFGYDEYDEIQALISEFNNSEKGLTATYFNTAKKSTKSDKLKKMLRKDIIQTITKDDDVVIENLITSTQEDDILVAIQVIDKFKKKDFRSKIKEFVTGSSNRNLILSSLISLGKIGNEEDIEIIASFLNSENQQERRIAIEALGNFKDISSNLLYKHYVNENSFGNRVALIEAVERIQNISKKNEIFTSLLKTEQNNYIHDFIKNRIKD